ncbi:MAG TPA: AHH domain-containing protein, partial [Hyalangium sp.]|nr:AHH domain-containing protein [Hyalangium sp.]
AQVSMQAGGEGLLLSEVGAVQAVTVTGEGFSVALAPGAVAMAAQGGGRGGRVERHHIGTISNKKSALRGGPWTQRFEKLFARAGMRLKDAENIVPIQGHKGPHPQQYHEIVFRRLDRALGDCSTISNCRGRLTRELRAIAEEIATPGTELNRLVTFGK